MPHRAENRLATTVVLFVAAATHLAAQQPTIAIGTTVSCRSCRIELERVVTLGSPGDTVSPTDFQTSVSRDSRGRYHLAPTSDLATMAVYDSTGRLLRTLGRGGQGPGEYNFIVRADVGPADSVFVLDPMSRRLTVLSPSYSVARTTPMAGHFTRAHFPGDGRVLMNGSVRTGPSAGQPLHLIGADGRIVRSFGNTRPELRRDREHADMRFTELGNARDIWAARPDRYEVELWSVDGKLVRTFRRTAPWFPQWNYGERRASDAPPRPMLLAVWPDSAGRAWTLVRVASGQWKPPPGAGGSREVSVPPFDEQDRGIDTMIEVFDPNTGALVASQRVPQFILGNVGRDTIYSLRATDDGDLRVDVWRIRLVQR